MLNISNSSLMLPSKRSRSSLLNIDLLLWRIKDEQGIEWIIYAVADCSKKTITACHLLFNFLCLRTLIVIITQWTMETIVICIECSHDSKKIWQHSSLILKRKLKNSSSMYIPTNFRMNRVTAFNWWKQSLIPR